MIEDLIQDWGLDLEGAVSGRRRVVADLGVRLGGHHPVCVALRGVLWRKFSFQSLLMHDGSYVGDLSVDQIAKFIASRLAAQTEP